MYFHTFLPTRIFKNIQTVLLKISYQTGFIIQFTISENSNNIVQVLNLRAFLSRWTNPINAKI